MLRSSPRSGYGRYVKPCGDPHGGPFENIFSSVLLSDRDRLERYEIFDVADDDRALARFAELCAARA